MKADVVSNRSAGSADSKKSTGLRFLDLSFEAKDQMFKNDELDNGRFPHGGYKGSRRQPLGLYSFDKGREFHRQLRDDLDLELEREMVGVLGTSPSWALDAHRWPTHTGESPLLAHGFLAASKLEGKNGFSRLPATTNQSTRTASSSASSLVSALGSGSVAGNAGGVVYYRPNRAHPYLTATEFKDCSSADCEDLVRYGRPTRTTLLRARQKLNSSANSYELRRQLDQRMEEMKMSCAFSNPKELLQLESEVDGETFYSFITGARYNRANCLDSRSAAQHGVYMSRHNPLGCFVLPQKLDALDTTSAPPEGRDDQTVVVLRLPPTTTSTSQRPGTTQSETAVHRRKRPVAQVVRDRRRRAETRRAASLREGKKGVPSRPSAPFLPPTLPSLVVYSGENATARDDTTDSPSDSRCCVAGSARATRPAGQSPTNTATSDVDPEAGTAQHGDLTPEDERSGKHDASDVVDYEEQGDSPRSDTEEGPSLPARPTTTPGQGKKPLGPVPPHAPLPPPIPPPGQAWGDAAVAGNGDLPKVEGLEADIRPWSPQLRIRGSRVPINSSREGPFKFECRLPRLGQMREGTTDDPAPNKQPPPTPMPPYIRLDNSTVLPAVRQEPEAKPDAAQSQTKTEEEKPSEEKEEEKTEEERRKTAEENAEEPKEEATKEETTEVKVEEELEKEEEEKADEKKEGETAAVPEGEKEADKEEKEETEKADTETPADDTAEQRDVTEDETPPAAEDEQQQPPSETQPVESDEAQETPQEESETAATTATADDDDAAARREKTEDDVKFFVTEGAGVDADTTGDVTTTQTETGRDATEADMSEEIPTAETDPTEKVEDLEDLKDPKESSSLDRPVFQNEAELSELEAQDTDVDEAEQGQGQAEPLKVVVTHIERGGNSMAAPPPAPKEEEEEEEEEVIAKHP